MKIICHRAQIFVTVQLKDFFNTSQCCVVLCCVVGGRVVSFMCIRWCFHVSFQRSQPALWTLSVGSSNSLI